MSAHKFVKEDFDNVQGIFVYATPSAYTGVIAVYELIDAENTVYQEIEIIASTLIDGVLTLLAERPFEGQAVVTDVDLSQNQAFQSPII